MIKNNKLQAIIKMGIGCVLLFSVIWGYFPIPRHMNEYTFLSNTIESLVLIYSGILLIYKQKHIPTYIDLCLVILAFIMMGIVVTNYKVFGFDGAYLFLHVINPILLLLHWVFVTEKGKIKSPKYVLSVLILPAMYITFLFIFGYITGNYIYPVLDINALGVLNVAVFVIIVAVLSLGLAYALYRACKGISFMQQINDTYKNSELNNSNLY